MAKHLKLILITLYILIIFTSDSYKKENDIDWFNKKSNKHYLIPSIRQAQSEKHIFVSVKLAPKQNAPQTVAKPDNQVLKCVTKKTWKESEQANIVNSTILFQSSGNDSSGKIKEYKLILNTTSEYHELSHCEVAEIMMGKQTIKLTKKYESYWDKVFLQDKKDLDTFIWDQYQNQIFKKFKQEFLNKDFIKPKVVSGASLDLFDFEEDEKLQDYIDQEEKRSKVLESLIDDLEDDQLFQISDGNMNKINLFIWHKLYKNIKVNDYSLETYLLTNQGHYKGADIDLENQYAVYAYDFLKICHKQNFFKKGYVEKQSDFKKQKEDTEKNKTDEL